MDGSEAHGHPAMEFLSNLRRGTLLDALAEQIAYVTSEVESTHRSGTITLRIKVAPVKGSADQLEVTDTLTAKPPEREQPPAYFWLLEDGRLSRRDPRQPSLPGIAPVEPFVAPSGPAPAPDFDATEAELAEEQNV